MASTVLRPLQLHTMRQRLSVSSSQASDESASSSESPKQSPGYYIALQFSNPKHNDDIVPKIEEADDEEVTPGDISPVATVDSNTSVSGHVIKRPRGRPRKHFPPTNSAVTKAPKGRSKTGCITCRRRKKKCDEAKPSCLHCQKNNVVCEGYSPKSYWRPGKHNMGEGRKFSVDLPPMLPVLIKGVENDMDRLFLEHFESYVSRVLSLFTDDQNPFTELIMPMAVTHEGLMHSLLSLSGSHILSIQDLPEKDVVERTGYHFDRAVHALRTDPQIEARIKGDRDQVIDDPTVAQTIVLCLKPVVSGEVNGEYRPHLDAAKHILSSQISQNHTFQNFLYEFYMYHDVSNSITCLDRPNVLMTEDFKLPEFMMQPEAGVFLGVVDGLFGFISKIRQLRDRIRERKAKGITKLVDFSIISDANAIDSALRGWTCGQPENTFRWTAAILYQQCTWIYLNRTIMPSKPSAELEEAVDRGLALVRQLPPDSSPQSILLMPLFILGCAAFEKHQRPEIEHAFDDLIAYSHLGNIGYARKIVEIVWTMMDAGQEESWDWEAIIRDRGWDFLVT